MSWILTHSGWHFDRIDPQPDMVDDDAIQAINEASVKGGAA